MYSIVVTTEFCCTGSPPPLSPVTSSAKLPFSSSPQWHQMDSCRYRTLKPMVITALEPAGARDTLSSPGLSHALFLLSLLPMGSERSIVQALRKGHLLDCFVRVVL